LESNVTLDSERVLVNKFFVAHIAVTADDLENFAQMADSYAAMIREWKTAVANAHSAGIAPTMNGLQTLRGNLAREIEKAAKLSGQAIAIQKKADRAKARGEKAHAAKADRRKKGS
jgi:hypothetical protein